MQIIKKKKNWSNLVIILSFLMIFNFIITNQYQISTDQFMLDSSSQDISKTSVNNITITFKDITLNLTIYSCKINISGTQTTVFDATIEALGGVSHINYIDSYMGVFINDMEVNGTWYRRTNQRFWVYYVNNEFASVSCSKYSLQSNDTILWTYSDPQSSTGNTTEDYTEELIMFVIILGIIISGLILLGLFLKKRSN
ncbi:MAG: DUF4430 domain-containing protein [Candidatus Helarchaeota archaeon]